MPSLRHQRNQDSLPVIQESRTNFSFGSAQDKDTNSLVVLQFPNGNLERIHNHENFSNEYNLRPYPVLSFSTGEYVEDLQPQHDTPGQKNDEFSSPAESIHALDDEFHHNIATSKSKVQNVVFSENNDANYSGEIWPQSENPEKINNVFLHQQSPFINGTLRDSVVHVSNRTINMNETEDEIMHKKVAPRSHNQFRVGPPFHPTKLHRSVFCDSTSEQVFPIMTSRIDRGFELGETGHWIGYKKNYVSLVSTFTFEGWNFEQFLQHKYFVLDENHGNGKVMVKYFAFAISVKCNSPDFNVGLVQHTPKRDKGPKYVTPIYPAVPGGKLPDHETVRISSNKKNRNRVASLQKIFNFDRKSFYTQHNLRLESDTTILKNYPEDLLTKVAQFERIQFTKSLRVEPRSAPKKFFTLSVKLLGFLDESTDNPRHVVLATSDTAPVLVRGRSASMYSG